MSKDDVDRLLPIIASSCERRLKALFGPRYEVKALADPGHLVSITLTAGDALLLLDAVGKS